MEHALSRMWSHIRHQSVAALLYMHFPRDVCCHSKQFARQCIVLFLQGSYILHVLFGNEEHMHRRLWIQVLESINILILVHAGRGYLLLRDSAKDAILHPHALLKKW